ncbi:heterokaryon incompatibility protein-domain-containing protein [Xylaria palmicola]|nr:heterokaryon incompatibility protein-domain-containing protein [Xylaria palmicola]
MAYQYSPLRPDCVRLLKPYQSQDEADLSFTIQHVSRSEMGCFTALTYAWGDEEATETVSLNNMSFYVTPHLKACLRVLSCAAPSRQWDRIWVDAICIDQSNDQERNDQVREMHEIYRGAECVSLWLGSPPDSIHAHFQCENAVKYLLEAGYWTRRWIIQEFLLARNIEIYCGMNSIFWDELTKIISVPLLTKIRGYISTYIPKGWDLLDCLIALVILLETNAKIMRPPVHFITNKPYLSGDLDSEYNLLSLIYARNSGTIVNKGLSLRNLLARFYRYDCKDPRDRVFSFLSLLPQSEKDSLAQYFPDYSLNKDQVAIITLAHIQHWRGSKTPIGIESDMLFDSLGIEKEKSSLFLELGEAFHYYKLLPRSPQISGRWFTRISTFSVVFLIIVVILWTFMSMPFAWKVSFIEEMLEWGSTVENKKANGTQQMNSTSQAVMRW